MTKELVREANREHGEDGAGRGRLGGGGGGGRGGGGGGGGCGPELEHFDELQIDRKRFKSQNFKTSFYADVNPLSLFL